MSNSHDHMLLDHVQIRQGTASTHAFSNGNTLPLVGMPFGNCHWTFDTSGGKWFYHPHERKLRGIRATRQPSPWIGDYGSFSFLPQSGVSCYSAETRAAAFRPEDALLAPDALAVQLLRDRAHVRLSASERCAIADVHFTTPAARRVLFDGGNGSSSWGYDAATQTLQFSVTNNNGGVPDNFACYYHIDIKGTCIAEQSGVCCVAVEHAFQAGIHQCEQDNGGFVLEIEQDCRDITLYIGSSFISCEQAALNKQHELAEHDRRTLRRSVAETWNTQLACISIDGASTAQRDTFYSALYRCFLFPRQLHEYDADHNQLHYSPYDGRIHAGPLYTDNGFWDTHRTVYPLFSLLCPERLSEMLAGFINACREGGWMPKWASPGYRACMIGTHIDAVFADACVKDIPFDIDAAYRGLLKHAFETGDGSNRHARIGLEYFEELGYVPCDKINEATSRTLDFACNDWCIAQIAERLNDHCTRDRLLERADYYRNVFDPEVGFMRGRNADGSWRDNGVDDGGFSATEWGGPFVEGSAWQCGWAVQHDVDGFIALHGGARQLEGKLDRLLATPPFFEVGSYGREIHEMSEMAAVDFGQYAQSNQPSHHILYFYTLVGRTDKCGHWIRRTCNELYNANDNGLPGDEDNGEMSAWYVFSALGFYPFCPGKAAYVLGSPLFDQATIHLARGKTFTVTAADNKAEHAAVAGWQLNKSPLSGVWLTHQDIIAGGELRAQMSACQRWREHSNSDDGVP